MKKVATMIANDCARKKKSEESIYQMKCKLQFKMPKIFGIRWGVTTNNRCIISE